MQNSTFINMLTTQAFFFFVAGLMRQVRECHKKYLGEIVFFSFMHCSSLYVLIFLGSWGRSSKTKYFLFIILFVYPYLLDHFIFFYHFFNTQKRTQKKRLHGFEILKNLFFLATAILGISQIIFNKEKKHKK